MQPHVHHLRRQERRGLNRLRRGPVHAWSGAHEASHRPLEVNEGNAARRIQCGLERRGRRDIGMCVGGRGTHRGRHRHPTHPKLGAPPGEYSGQRARKRPAGSGRAQPGHPPAAALRRPHLLTTTSRPHSGVSSPPRFSVELGAEHGRGEHQRALEAEEAGGRTCAASVGCTHTRRLLAPSSPSKPASMPPATTCSGSSHPRGPAATACARHLVRGAWRARRGPWMGRCKVEEEAGGTLPAAHCIINPDERQCALATAPVDARSRQQRRRATTPSVPPVGM